VTPEENTVKEEAETETETGQSDRPSKQATQQILGNIITVNELTPDELNLLVHCCQPVDITPRTAKRLINIYKVLKIIWEERAKGAVEPIATPEARKEVKKVVMGFLALSGRYPTWMRELFMELDVKFEEANLPPTQLLWIDWDEFKPSLNPPSESDIYAYREWRRFDKDVERIFGKTFGIYRNSFHLALSFCFVGDIGYDPSD
jgi:hypothetical protein